MSLFSHPQNVCMTYFQHMKLSLHFSYLFVYAGFAAVIHAFIPNICITHTSDTIKQIDSILKESGCID